MSEETYWPSAGNKFCFDLFKDVIFSSRRSSKIRRITFSIIADRIYDNKSPQFFFHRAGIRLKFQHAFKKELEKFLRASPTPPQDLFDVLANQYSPDMPIGQISQIYISFIFSLVGSIGFALGWSLYLSVSRDALNHDTDHIISESLRLYPIAWMTQRRPTTSHQILGETVTKNDLVTVSSFAMQRSPRNWDHPQDFKPQRWCNASNRSAWLPFGAGPHMCIGVGMTFEIVAQLLAALTATRRLSVICADPTPDIGPALRPPKFTLRAQKK